MAMCVEVEERAPLKLGCSVAVVNSVNAQLCHYCQKPGHKYRMCRQKELDQAAGKEPPPTAKRHAFHQRPNTQGSYTRPVPGLSSMAPTVTSAPAKQVSLAGPSEEKVVTCYK